MLGIGTLTVDGWARYAGLASVCFVGVVLAYQVAERDKAAREAAAQPARDDGEADDAWDDETRDEPGS